MKKFIVLLLIISIMSVSSGVIGGEEVPNFDFKFDENDMPGSMEKLLRYLKWFNSNLDETNIKYLAWGDSIVDNVDATHKIKLKFYIPDGVIKVQKLTLNFSVEPFRAYETGAAAGGGSVTTSSSGGDGTFTSTMATGLGYGGSTDSAGGSHGHEIIDPGYTEWEDISHSHNFSVTLSDHDHDVTLPSHDHDVTFPDHAHGIDYGIFEDTTAAECKVYVDGELRLDNGGSGYNDDQANLDLTQWVNTPGWHMIEVSSSQLGRINAAYFIQIYAGPNGI
jgi:hypothetical protein